MSVAFALMTFFLLLSLWTTFTLEGAAHLLALIHQIIDLYTKMIIAIII